MHGDVPTQEVVKGSGTLGDPQITLLMSTWAKQSVTDDRCEACIQIDGIQHIPCARYLGRTHACIRAYNHGQRFLYDMNGNALIKRDSYGKPIYNTWGHPVSETEDADNQIPCNFYNCFAQMYKTAHVYVVIDTFQVPRRLMLMNTYIGKRRHIQL